MNSLCHSTPAGVQRHGQSLILLNMTRREMITLAAAAPLAAMASPAPGVKFGVDLFSLRSQNWSPFELLDYCAARGVVVVHFSEIRFIGSLEADNLKRVREHAGKLGIETEIGMRSICPTSKMFDAGNGSTPRGKRRLGRFRSGNRRRHAIGNVLHGHQDVDLEVRRLHLLLGSGGVEAVLDVVVFGRRVLL